MKNQTSKLERLLRGITKFSRRFVWTLLRLIAQKPVVEMLYQSDDKKSLVFCCHGPVYIEPETGYFITERGYLFEDAMLPNFAHPKRPFEISVPSPFAFFRFIKQKDKIIERDTVVSLRHFWEWNYYHFYLDVLGKLALFQSSGINNTLPLVIAKYADDVSFVRPLIGRGKFANRNWIIPATEYVKANKVLFCRTEAAYASRVSFILDALDVGKVSSDDNKRYYLKRSSNRRLTNLAEIQPVLEKYGFETIDAAQMSIDEQIDTFSKARYPIANHGAGTTNILFRGTNPLSVLELHHENLMNYDHKRMSEQMGYQWDALEGKMGEGHPHHADFTVPVDELEQKIIQMLSASNGRKAH